MEKGNKGESSDRRDLFLRGHQPCTSLLPRVICFPEMDDNAIIKWGKYTLRNKENNLGLQREDSQPLNHRSTQEVVEIVSL